MTRLRLSRHRAVLLALVAVGALLRFSTLDVQNFWLDEAVTTALLRLDLHDMFATMSATESTPPLYYLVAWAWVVPFGTGEVGLRGLSALAGTLTIPVAYAAAGTLASRETGLFVAALTAVNPALVWYSQEARSYSLLLLLCALSLLFLARALRSGSRRAVAWWALTAVLSLLTHYFAGFLIAAEGLWLLVAYPRRKVAAAAVGSVMVMCAALLPLALHQSSQGSLDFIGQTPLATRVASIGELFLVGQTGTFVQYGLPVLAALALVAFALVLKADAAQRQSLIVPMSLALAGISIPVLLALAGADYVLARNFLPFWLPAAIVVAIGLSASRSRRLGAGTGAALIAGSIWMVAAVTLDRPLQREAITAALVPGKLDVREQRIAPRITYVKPDAGEPVRGTAGCPGGYSAASGGASWVSAGADEPVPNAATIDSRRGWAATASPGLARGRALLIYSICVASAD